MNYIEKRHTDLIVDRFIDNPRMQLIFEKTSYYYPQHVHDLVRYCYRIALRLGGVFESSNRKAITLYYRKSQFHRNIIDLLRYLKVALDIGIRNIPKVLKQEKTIALKRKPLKDYIYVWFLAQDRNYKRLDGLIEIRDHLIRLSKSSQLPILMETTNSALIKFYHRAGFLMYDMHQIGEEQIYFFQYPIKQ